MEGDELDAAVHKSHSWYGIVDGEHSNLEFRWLTENMIKWKNYSFSVTILAGGMPLES